MPRTTRLISEIFYSIQGEGKLTGIPSAFIRTSGCNLRCTWCDTPQTSWEASGESLTVDQILDRISGFPTQHVVLTGGEPMIATGVEQLTHDLRARGYHITIETASTVWKEVVCDLASISPKLRNSTPWKRDHGRWAEQHERTRLNTGTIRRFMAMDDYQLKFVVETSADLGDIDRLLEDLEPYESGNILLMPQGTTRGELDERGPIVADLCKQRGFRYCPRLHITLYGNVPGT